MREFRDALADRKLQLADLVGDGDVAIRAYADMRFRRAAVERGRPYGLKYAERFHYIGPDTSLDDYVKEHAVPLS